MKTMMKICMFVFILLLVISIFKDLSGDTPITGTNDSKQNDTTTTINTTVMKVKVQEGETVLSIVEKINKKSLETLNIEKIMTDFKKLNPAVEPLSIQTGKFYYFPLY